LIFARSRGNGAPWLVFGSLTFRSLSPSQSRLVAATSAGRDRYRPTHRAVGLGSWVLSKQSRQHTATRQRTDWEVGYSASRLGNTQQPESGRTGQLGTQQAK
jgi:hypothetical protein